MKKRYWLIGIPALLFLILFSLKTYMNRHTVNCPEMSKAYEEWFPYNQNDILTFKNKDSIRQYEINTLSLNHTKNYQNNMKCGCCEDGIYISLIGKNDTIRISFSNFRNPYSCMGSTRYISRNENDLNVKSTQDSNDLKLNQILSDSILLKKGIGIKKIIWNGKPWEFESIKKAKNRNNLAFNNGC